MTPTYTAEDVERLLEAHFNGVAFKETQIPEGMPRASNNKARLGTDWAEAVDLKTALAECQVDIALLRLRYGFGRTVEEIEKIVHLPYDEINIALFEDVRLLRDRMNKMPSIY